MDDKQFIEELHKRAEEYSLKLQREYAVKELEKIKAEFEKEIEIKKKQNYSLDFFTGISDCIIITENRIDELKGENNE